MESAAVQFRLFFGRELFDLSLVSVFPAGATIVEDGRAGNSNM